MDREKVKEALQEIVANSEVPSLNYAINYAKYGLAMIASDAENHDLKVQLLYVRNNISYWRGETAKRVRLILKENTK